MAAAVVLLKLVSCLGYRQGPTWQAWALLISAHQYPVLGTEFLQRFSPVARPSHTWRQTQGPSPVESASPKFSLSGSSFTSQH